MAKAEPSPLVAGELLSLSGDVAALLDLGRANAVHPPFVNPDGSITHFLGEGVHAEDEPPLNPILPNFVSIAEVLVEPASFVDYIVNYKTISAICRASLGQNQIVAILDYHGRAREGDATRSLPDRLAHTVTLKCPFDVDYAKWRNAFGQKMNQAELAEFLEDMIHTIGEPPAADLLEAISDLKIDRQVRFKSARNDRNGNIQFTYDEVDDEKVTGSVTLPDHVQIIVPIFQGGNPQALVAKLRYRMEKGQVAFNLSVPGLDKLEREAFRSIGERVRDETATPVFYTA